MRLLRLAICFCALFVCCRAGAEEPWRTAIATMPLTTNVAELNRTNCVETMLRALQSNNVVKGLVFMPGATDEFYMFRRAKASLTNSTPTLLDAVVALTNQTYIRATFRSPLLLLHTDEDCLEPISEIKHADTAARIRQTSFVPHAVWNDRDWNFLLPVLKKTYGINFTPKLDSRFSFHFYRHSLAAWNLGGWEALEAISLAGKTRFTVERKQVNFEGDTRVKSSPILDGFPEFRK